MDIDAEDYAATEVGMGEIRNGSRPRQGHCGPSAIAGCGRSEGGRRSARDLDRCDPQALAVGTATCFVGQFARSEERRNHGKHQR